MSDKKTVILVAGYRGMGKDYISQNGLSSYEIFFKPGVTKSKLNVLSCLGKVPIFKFADPLRNLLGPFMGLSPELIAQYDSIKDVHNKIPYNSCIRDYFIGIGAAVRAIDPDFFAKRTILAIEQCQENTVVVSDWRYPNELKCMEERFNVVTVRVHRIIDAEENITSIPGPEVTSERSLDKVETDFFVFPRFNMTHLSSLFKQVEEVFPQYSKYSLFMSI